MRYIVLGKTELKEELFNKDLTNNGINKPKGGLWSSPYNKDTISGWYQFCKEQNFVKADNTVGVIFTLKEEARVYTIDSKEDLDNLVNKYPNDVLEILKEIAGLNFIAVSKDYDAIYLTDKGQWATRFSQPNTLYGWDCETLLVLNFNAIDLDSIDKFNE